jgi:hypothetical protein
MEENNNNYEFLATLHQQEKESMYILKMILNWLDIKDSHPTVHAKNMIDMYRRKGKDLFANKVSPNEVRFKPFKSLMQQLADGELSHRLKS